MSSSSLYSSWSSSSFLSSSSSSSSTLYSTSSSLSSLSSSSSSSFSSSAFVTNLLFAMSQMFLRSGQFQDKKKVDELTISIQAKKQNTCKNKTSLSITENSESNNSLTYVSNLQKVFRWVSATLS